MLKRIQTLSGRGIIPLNDRTPWPVQEYLQEHRREGRRAEQFQESWRRTAMNVMIDLCIVPLGAPRITTTIKLGTRTDRAQSMEDKVRSVREKL